MKFKIAALFFAVLVGASCAAKPPSEGILLREISYHRPESVSQFYRFPGPIKSVTVDLKVQGEYLESAQVKFGNGKIVRISQSILGRFRRPLMQESFFLATTPDAHVMEKNWDPTLVLPYRPKTETDTDTSADHDDLLPYVLFQIRDWKLVRLVIERKDGDQAISLPMDKCPSEN